MENDEEQVDGQLVARAILNGDPNAWDEFQEVFGDLISKMASDRARSTKLRAEFSPEDIVQGFVAERLLKQPEKMFGPVAKGQRPLTPRLLRSLANYCNSLQRRRKRLVQPKTDLESSPDERFVDEPALLPTEVVDQIRRRIREQQTANRNAFAESSRARIPQREILLLSERISFAGQIIESFCREDHSDQELHLVSEMVVVLYPLSDDESSTLIPMVNEPLSTVWQSLSVIFFAPPFLADGNAVADQIEVVRNTWDIWVRRARQRVIAHAGHLRSKEMFPHWPSRLTEVGKTVSNAEQGEPDSR